MSDRQSIRRFASYVKPYWRDLFLMLAALFASTLLSLAIPWIIGVQLIDKVILERSLSLEAVLVMFAGTSLAKELFDFINDYLLESFAQNVTHTLRSEFFENLLYVPLSFLDQSQTGDLLSRMQHDVNTVGDILKTLVKDLGSNVFTLVGTLLFLFSINMELTLIIAPTVLAIFITVTLFKGRIKRMSRGISKATGILIAGASEVLSGIRVVKSFVKEEDEVKVFRKKSKAIFRANINLMKLSAIYTSSVSMLVLIGMVLVIWFWTPMTIAGTITVGGFSVYLNYIRKIHEPVKGLSKVNFKVQRALAAADRLFYLSTMPVRPAEQGLAILPPISGHIRFTDVSFAYDEGHPVLQNLNLDIRPNEVVAIVGASGSGKSTILNLLLGFYEAQQGEITVDGHPVSGVDLRSLRSQVGIVTQETFLFSGSVWKNIGYGKQGASKKEIKRAAKLANAHDFIMGLPHGYDTRIGERGVNLSSGQKQRIAIARAILKEPRILILDEATSNVDPASEALIQDALELNVGDRTTIIIGHRLSSVMRADKIVALERGEIVETGTHSELLENQGVYAKLFTL